MSITVRIPAMLREYVNQNPTVEISEAKTLNDVLLEIGNLNENIKKRIFNDEGQVQPYLNVFINNRESDEQGGLAAELNDGDEIYIIASIAGG
jgi:MoaD family protein